MKVAVIGAGPAGLAAAARLAKAGISVHIFEASAELGGLARSLSLWGREVELSAHIFRSSNDFVNDLWQVNADDLLTISLRRGIYDGHRIIEYPLTPFRILKRLGFLETTKCALGVAKARWFRIGVKQPKNAEDWMIQRFGKPLHERFLRHYAEKLWGIPCNEIHASFPQFLFQSAGDSEGGQQSFSYPRGGNSSVWRRLGKSLEDQGVVIHTDSRVQNIHVEHNTVTGLTADGQSINFDHVVSTMPLGLLARLTLPSNSEAVVAAAELKARSTVLVYLRTDASNKNHFNWVSIYPENLRLGRITDFGQWLDSNDGSTVLCLEYWCDRGDNYWNQSNEDIVALAAHEVNQTNLMEDVRILQSHVERLSGTHPVFTLQSQNSINTINSALANIQGLSTVGRHGAHGVLGMGESMEAACEVSDAVIQSKENIDQQVKEA